MVGVTLLGASAAAQSAVPLGIWAAALPLGGGDPAVAVARGDQVAGLLSALAVGVQVDEASAAWLADLRNSIFELDLARTLERLPRVEGDRRSVQLVGENRGAAGYMLQLSAAPKPARGGFGALGGDVGLRPQEWDRSAAFVADGSLWLSTGPMGNRELRGAMKGLLQAVSDAAGPQRDVRALEHQLRADMPATFAWIDEGFTIDRIGKAGPEDTLAIDLQVGVDPDRLAAHGHGALAGFVRRMGDVLDFSLSVASREGHLGTMWVRSPASFGLRLHTRDGQLIPSRAGTVNVASAVDVATVRSLDLALKPRGVVRLSGTRLSFDGWTVPLKVRTSATGTTMVASFSTMPVVDFRSDGGLGGWIAAAAGSTIGLESHARRFFQGMSEGPQGKGSRAELAIAPRGSESAVGGVWDLLLLDNLVVRFAAQVMGQRIVPADDVMDDFLALEGGLSAALATDWHAARDHVGAAVEPSAGDPE